MLLLKRNWLMTFTVLLSGCICNAALAADISSGWPKPGYERRCVMTIPRDAGPTVILSIPPGSASGQMLALDASGFTIPFRIIATNSIGTSLLLGTQIERRGRKCAVYFANTNSAAEPQTGNLSDPTPVRMEIRMPRGQGIPNSWARMHYLFNHSAVIDTTIRSSVEDPVVVEPRPDGEKPKGPWLLRLTSTIDCPSDGTYTFAINCRNAGFMFIDGEPVANWPGEHEQGDWQVGSELRLNAGPHDLEVYAYAKDELFLRVGWRVPQGGSIVPVPRSAYLSATKAQEIRIERFGQTLRPDFRIDIRRAYSLPAYLTGTVRASGIAGSSVAPGNDERQVLFIPVSFDNTTANMLSDSRRSKWSFGDGGESQEDSPVHIYTSPGLYRTTLRVRDDLGFEALCERVIDCRFVPREEFSLDVDVVSVWPMCYPADRVTPGLRIVGNFTRRAGVDVSWEIHPKTGRAVANLQGSAKVIEPTHDLTMFAGSVGSVARIEWEIKHKGVTLKTGVLKFADPPFETLPATADGDRFFDDNGAQIIMVPHGVYGDYTQPRLTNADVSGGMAFIGDSSAFSELFYGEGRKILMKRLGKLPGVGRSTSIEHFILQGVTPSNVYGPMCDILRAGALPDKWPRTVFLCVGLEDMIKSPDVASFERRIAAITDIVASTMKKRVVWVVPPPQFADPVATKPYAAAIMRVAEARNIPVADMYTAFYGTGYGREMFEKGRDMTLSRTGCAIAAEVMARALASGLKGMSE